MACLIWTCKTRPHHGLPSGPVNMYQFGGNGVSNAWCASTPRVRYHSGAECKMLETRTSSTIQSKYGSVSTFTPRSSAIAIMASSIGCVHAFEYKCKETSNRTKCCDLLQFVGSRFCCKLCIGQTLGPPLQLFALLDPELGFYGGLNNI